MAQPEDPFSQIRRTMKAIQKSLAPLSDPKVVEAMRTQISPLSDPKVVEAMRTQISPLWDPKALQDIRRQLEVLEQEPPAVPVDDHSGPVEEEVSRRLDHWDEAVEEALKELEAANKLPVTEDEEFAWLDWLPPLSQLKLLITALDILNALLIVGATFEGGVLPLKLALVAVVLLKLASALAARLEGTKHDKTD